MRNLILIIWCVALAGGTVEAVGLDAAAGDEAETPPEKKAEPKQWYEKLSFDGELRLRYEGFSWRDHFDDGRRDRLRYRLRFGFRGKVLDNLALGFQLRSGNPQNPISDNQSFDDGFSRKPISIGEVYADWQVAKPLRIIAGKFSPTKLWSVADIEWDDDVVTEGAMELFAWKPGGMLKQLDLNLYQLVLNESGDSIESYMLGGQIVPVFELGEQNDLAVGATFQAISHPEKVAALYFEDALVIDSGYVTNFIDPDTGEMISDFRVGSLFLEWRNGGDIIKGWPIKVSLFFYKNFGAGDGEGAILPVDGEDALAFGRGTDNDTAWFGRIQVGDYKKPGQVALRLSRYDSRPDAMFFAYSQSDSRRASNLDGYRTDVRVGMPKKGYINVTWYRTDWTIGEDSTMHRWQLDYVFRF